MKGIKRGLFIVVFIISLVIINTNIKAYDIYVSNVATYTEKEIYEYFSKIENFNINEYKNIFCTASGSYHNCYALTDKSVETLTYPNYNVTLTDYTNCNYYILVINNKIIEPTTAASLSCSHNNGSLIGLSNKTSSNFNFNFLSDSYNNTYNVLDFSEYMSQEETEELEITTTVTNILNFMLDKIKYIFEVLINNQLFQLCLGVLISYLIFIIVCRIIKK